MEEYITRSEFEAFKKHIEQKTDEVKAVRVEVASKDVLDRLDKLEQNEEAHFDAMVKTVQDAANELKDSISEVKTVQSGHAKFFEEHGKRLAATATKDDVNNRFDKVEGDIAELKGLITQLLQQKSGE